MGKYEEMCRHLQEFLEEPEEDIVKRVKEELATTNPESTLKPVGKEERDGGA